MDPAARDIWEASKPHAPAALLAYLVRENLPFPQTNVPPVAPGLNKLLAVTGWTAEMYGPEYLHFRCPVCRTSIYEPASNLGMSHVRRAVHRWHPAACPERAALNRETIWPDSLEG